MLRSFQPAPYFIKLLELGEGSSKPLYCTRFYYLITVVTLGALAVPVAFHTRIVTKRSGTQL